MFQRVTDLLVTAMKHLYDEMRKSYPRLKAAEKMFRAKMKKELYNTMANFRQGRKLKLKIAWASFVMTCVS